MALESILSLILGAIIFGVLWATLEKVDNINKEVKTISQLLEAIYNKTSYDEQN